MEEEPLQQYMVELDSPCLVSTWCFSKLYNVFSGLFYFPDSLLCLRFIAQGLQTALDLQLWTNADSPLKFSLWDIPLLSWLSGSLSLLVVLIINEIVKLHEIRYFFFSYKVFLTVVYHYFIYKVTLKSSLCTVI